jgi:hypothetical protein
MTALLKVYGVALSQPARSVLWALAINEVSWLETCMKDWCVSAPGECVQNARCSNDHLHLTQWASRAQSVVIVWPVWSHCVVRDEHGVGDWAMHSHGWPYGWLCELVHARMHSNMDGAVTL